VLFSELHEAVRLGEIKICSLGRITLHFIASLGSTMQEYRRSHRETEDASRCPTGLVSLGTLPQSLRVAAAANDSVQASKKMRPVTTRDVSALAIKVTSGQKFPKVSRHTSL
jgi:hypothetical protein